MVNIYYQGSRLSSIASAVDHSLGTGYTGSELEKLQKENEMLRAMLCRVVEMMYDDYYDRSKPKQLEYILGFNYEVIE